MTAVATARTGTWQRSDVLVAVLAVAAVAALWPSIGSLYDNWREIYEYRHGFLIAAVSAIWLIQLARRRPVVTPRFSPVATVLLAACLCLWLIAHRANSILAAQLLFPPALWLAILSVGGWRLARPAIAPVAYLYFAVPVWEYLVPLLQQMSVLVTESALSLAGVPAVVTEYSVAIPAGTFEIVEGCSGKRFLIVTLAFAVAAGALQRMHGLRFVAFVLAAGALALVANWIRIFVVIYAGHLTDMQHYLVAREHESFGNVLLVLVLVLLGTYLWSRKAGGDRAASRAAGASDDAPSGPTAPGIALGIPIALFLSVLAVTRFPEAIARTADAGKGALPFVAGDLNGPFPATASWRPRYVRPDGEMQASYRSRNGAAIEVYVNYYLSQQPGRELVYHENSILAPGNWKRKWPVASGLLQSDHLPALATTEARSPSGEAWLLAYVYRVGRWHMREPVLAQAAYGVQSILRPTPAGIVVFGVQCRENCQEAQELVRSFWRDMSAPILEMISGHDH